MNEKIKLLDLLRNEIDKLKTSNSSLDGEVLELMFNATSRDIYKDVLWGSRINNEDEEEDKEEDDLEETLRDNMKSKGQVKKGRPAMAIGKKPAGANFITK